MESRGSTNPKNKYAASATKSGIVIGETNATPTNKASTDHGEATGPLSPKQQPLKKRGPDQYMPIANVTRIMHRALPPDVEIADDVKETIQQSVTEFINFVTAEANKKCHREYRKTVAAEDVLAAMGSLGLHNYAELLSTYLSKYRNQDSRQGTSSNCLSTKRTGSDIQPEQATPAWMATSTPPPLPGNHPPPNFFEILPYPKRN